MRVNMHANGHVYGQLSLDDPEKSALYHEPFRPGDYSKTLPSETIRQTDYDEHYQIGENYQLSRLSCIPSTNLTKIFSQHCLLAASGPRNHRNFSHHQSR